MAKKTHSLDRVTGIYYIKLDGRVIATATKHPYGFALHGLSGPEPSGSAQTFRTMKELKESL